MNMEDDLIEAQIIIEAEGSFYRVRLQSVPQPGEIIHLTSHQNMVDKVQPYFFRVEVLRVEHEIADFVQKDGRSTASHSISVIVKVLGS